VNPLLLAALLGADPEIPAEPARPPVIEAEPAVAAPPIAAPPAEPPPALAFRGHLEWITAAGGADSRRSAVNPGNRVLELSAAGGQTELRPDLRLEYGGTLTAVARPRFLVKVEKAETADGWQPERSQATAEWIEGYGSWRVSDRLAIAYGLQNFQWGPG
jgi:hypothetical protein